MNRDDTFLCPICGAEVKVGAPACPECGSDDRTGWSEQTIYDGTGIEEPTEFDHAEWERRETSQRTQTPRLWWWVAWLALAALVAGFFLRG